MAAWIPLIVALEPEAQALVMDLINHFRKHPPSTNVSATNLIKTGMQKGGVGLSSTSLDPDVVAP